MPRTAHPALLEPRIGHKAFACIHLQSTVTLGGPPHRPCAEPIDARAGSVRHSMLFDIEQVVTAPGGVPNLR